MSLRQRIVAGICRWGPDALVLVALGALVASTLGIDLLNSANWPTGGDTASHLLTAWLYAEELLFSGHLTPWVPEVFGGLPFLSYYFPLPFIVIALLSKLIGFAAAFKWGAFGAAIVLPGAIFIGSRRGLGFPALPAFFAALGGLAFLFHEQNSIWGGNLLSTLAGEFAYSYGVLFAVLATMAWARVAIHGRGWVLAALLEAACGFSHGFPLLVVGFSTAFLLLECRTAARFLTLLRHLLQGHLLAFCLLGAWLWPMLEMHRYTIPNDAAFPLSSWRDLLPATLWPVFCGGATGLLLLRMPAVRQAWSPGQQLVLRYCGSVAALAALGFIVGDRIGLADIRFFPLVWLFGAIACGWLLGQALLGLRTQAQSRLSGHAGALGALALTLGLLGWLAQNIQEAPDWGVWNHSGLDAKPQWHNLSRLFPAMSGNLWSSRLLFEHDPDNNDLGSTRTLEALPMFLNHRPVLEGLYMESALLGPAVYQLQSEVSDRPSSPLVRFPGGSLDTAFAAQHMNFLHADAVLLRSERAKREFAANDLFRLQAEAPPFALYQLKRFDSRLLDVVRQPLRFHPVDNWMQEAFDWFRTRSRFTAYLPVYGAALPLAADAAAVGKDTAGKDAAIRALKLDRHELVFETEAVGRPHLLKMAYHPRWHLLSKGELRIAGPGYMLVVPEERQIRLRYERTFVGRLGAAATLLAALFIGVYGWRLYRAGLRAGAGAERLPDPAGSDRVLWLRAAVAWSIVAALGAYWTFNAPERAYARAWDLLNAGDYAAASAHFLRAYEERRPAAKKEEALFWTARTSEFSGNTMAATARYRELSERYHGYWLPESLYLLADLENKQGRTAEAERLRQRLRAEYPANPWTLKLESQP